MELFIDNTGEGLKYHSFEDIGRYTVFPENHWRRMFRRRGFGFIEKIDYDRNQTFGLMTREEGVRLANDFHRLTIPSQRDVNYHKIATDFSNYDAKEDVITE